MLLAFAEKIQPHFVIAYGAVAGARVEQLFPIVGSTYEGATKNWHELVGIGSIGHTKAGTIVARVGFFGQGQYARGNTDKLAEVLIKHRGSASPLAHPWSPEDAKRPR